jgi:hypothetical protein
MNRNGVHVACVALALVIAGGCGRDRESTTKAGTGPTPVNPSSRAEPAKPIKLAQPTSAPAASEQAPAGALQSAIDYGTGAAQVRAGRRAAQQIRTISEERDRQLRESLDATEP